MGKARRVIDKRPKDGLPRFGLTAHLILGAVLSAAS